MTVCIAALYRNDASDRGVILVHDWQITDTQTAFKSKGLKIANLSFDVAIMGAGDMTYFGDLVERIYEHLSSGKDPTVAEVADAYWRAEIDWQNEYRERHVLSKYGLSWKTYFEKLETNQLPEEFFTQVNDDLKNLKIPCDADAVVAGISRNDSGKAIPSIIKIADGIKESRGREGFAVIGEGDSIAINEFGISEYNRGWSKPSTMFLSYLAKKRSEAIASVGSQTNLVSVSTLHKLRTYPFELKENLEKRIRQLEATRARSERKAYERGKEIISEFEASSKRQTDARLEPSDD